MLDVKYSLSNGGINLEINILLVDDESSCLDSTKSALGNFSYVNIIGEATSAEEAINILQKHEVDLVFLDIEMNDINGFELAKHINSIYPNTMIIFLTGHTSFALTGYEYQPVDFLIKPVNMLRLEQALTRVKNLKYNIKEKKETKIGIHVEGGFEIINVNDISYIEKSGRKVYIVCENGDKFNSRDSLQKLENIFRDYGFYRSHQSFLVPIEKIKSIVVDEFRRSYTLKLDNVEEKLPLSRDKYNEVKELLLKKGMKFY